MAAFVHSQWGCCSESVWYWANPKDFLESLTSWFLPAGYASESIQNLFPTRVLILIIFSWNTRSPYHNLQELTLTYLQKISASTWLERAPECWKHILNWFRVAIEGKDQRTPGGLVSWHRIRPICCHNPIGAAWPLPAASLRWFAADIVLHHPTFQADLQHML